MKVSTAKALSSRRRVTIRHQVLLRLALVMLLLVLGISLVGYNSFMSRQQREIEQKHGITHAYYADQLPRLESDWQMHAEQLRSRIEFTRIVEEPEAIRWAKLTSFLTAQQEFIDFTDLLVVAGNGDVIYRYGSQGHKLASIDEAVNAGWHYASRQRDFYRVLTLPLWLGVEGQGSLVLLRPIDTPLLRSLLSPEVTLHVEAAAGIVASSHPEIRDRIDPEIEGLVRDGERQVIQIHLRWPHPGPLAPTLVVRRDFNESIHLGEYMMRPLIAITLVTVMLWLGLGRWLTRAVRRIESLDAAAVAFAGEARPEKAEAALAPASADNDEIGDVASTLTTLMHGVAERDREQRTYLETLAILEEAVLELDSEGRLLHASPGWYRLTHCQDDLANVALTEFIHMEDVEMLRNLYGAFKRRDKVQALLRLRLRSDLDIEQWAECRLIAEYDANGQLSGIRGVLRDITQTYLHEQKITHMALHDALTDLPNRVLLEDRIKIATRMASRSGQHVAVCFIDLDHFKKINDSLGHKAGDRLLISFATMLRSQLRAGDTLARWGGDEFVLLLPELSSEGDAREVTRKIEEKLRSPIRLDDSTDHLVTFSMGVAMYPQDAHEVEGLLSNADRAMFYAKTQGRNQTCFFGEVADKGGGKRELYIQNKLVEAVAAGQIQAWFQPIINAQNGACEMVEVLARWHDDEFGWISPTTFIPIAENTGTIRELGYLVWRQTLEALSAWRAGGETLRAAINVSKRQLFSGQFAQQLENEVKAAGLSPDAVTIEVTESVALLDVANASDRLETLHRIGFHIAIDDFGTGYSALSQLHEMPVDELKIDISFVRRLHEPDGRSMVQAIINLAKALGLKTIAEGVEDEAAANQLKTLGADYLQGYHYAKPMPRNEFEFWLAARTGQAGA